MSQSRLDHIPTKLYGGDAEDAVKNGNQRSSIEPGRVVVAKTVQIKILRSHKLLIGLDIFSFFAAESASAMRNGKTLSKIKSMI